MLLDGRFSSDERKGVLHGAKRTGEDTLHGLPEVDEMGEAVRNRKSKSRKANCRSSDIG